MPETKEIVRIFIASSSDLSEERKMFPSLFGDINKLLPHIHLSDIRWEKDMESGSVSGTNIQQDINQKILEECPIVIILLYSKIGEFTLEEYEKSLQSRKKVFVYFKQGFSPDDVSKATAYVELLRFQERLNRENRILYKKLSGLEDLRMQVYNDLLLYIKEKYPSETNSVMRIFRGLSLSEKEKNALNNICYLPLKYYAITEIASYFGSRSSEIEDPVRSLLEKGILIRDEHSNKYKVQDVIRRHVLSGANYGKDFTALVDILINKLNSELLAEGNQPFPNITLVEGLLSNLYNHDHPEVKRLKENLAFTYLRKFGIGSQSDAHIRNIILLLNEALENADADSDTPKGQLAKRRQLLAEVHLGTAELESDKSVQDRMFQKSRDLLYEIDPADIIDPLDSLRYHILVISSDLRDNESTDAIRDKFVDIFMKNKYVNYIELANSDLFLKVYDISLRLKIYSLCEMILKKIIQKEIDKYGEDKNFRLLHHYLKWGDLLMAQNNKEQSIKYFRKAYSIAENSPDPETRFSVNTRFAQWMQKFVPT